MKRIAIIGAGVAGLSAALKLEENGFDVSLFDKSRGVSGRAATRSRGNLSFDHGAQVFEMGDDQVESFIRGLNIKGLSKIDLPVWCFDIMDQVFEGDPVKNKKTRWTIESGIKHLGKSIEAKLSRPVNKQEEVRHLQKYGDKWAIQTANNFFDDFDLVVFATPGPQAAQIIEKSGIDRSYRDWLSIQLRQAVYRSILSFTFQWEKSILSEKPYSALINSDRLHAITWIGLEHLKPGRSETTSTMLVCQMSPDWSSLHFRQSLEKLQEEIQVSLSDLFDKKLPEPDFSDKQGWLYAIPDTLIKKEELNSLRSEGLYFAGDSYVGGRIHLAIKSGLDVADEISAGIPDESSSK